MSDYRSKLNEVKFHYWIKTGLALMYTKDGLQKTVEDEIDSFQKKTFDDIGIHVLPSKAKPSELDTCGRSSMKKPVYPQFDDICLNRKCSHLYKPCPYEQFKERITKAHRFKKPSWKNTDTKLWNRDPWQIAKCFMPSGGYSSPATATETDFNGIISVILNFKDFQNKLGEDLSNKNNNFQKARNVSRDFRHTATFEVSADKFQECMQILSTVLKDPKYINSQSEAKEALQKIEKLKNDTNSIALATEDIKDLVQEEMQFEVIEATDGAKKEQSGRYLMLQNAMQILSSTIDSVDMTLMHLKRRFSQFGHMRQREFAEQLIKIYRDQCSTLPISALLEEEDAQLLDFFAEPTMLQIDHHKIKASTNRVMSYKDIFFKDGRSCKNIYITGDAGIGKTAVCQRMVLTWCHAQSGGIADHNFSQVNIDAMKTFDMLFYVTLRETKLCHVVEIIKQQMQVPGKDDLITPILETESCLIILDGLDEWIHPVSDPLCPENTKVPHRQIGNDCTYLTTSRPWKLEEGDRLKTNEIDQLIELKGLGDAACNQLSISVVEHLNN